MQLAELIGWIRDGGAIVVLIFIVYGSMQEWWVTGRQYRRVLLERDELQQSLFRILGLTARAAASLDRTTTKMEEGALERRLTRLEGLGDVHTGRLSDDN